MNLKYIVFINIFISYTSHSMEKYDKPSQSIHLENIFTSIPFNDKTTPYYDLQMYNNAFRDNTDFAYFSYDHFEVRGKIRHITKKDLTQIGIGDAIYYSNIPQSGYGVVGIWTGPFYLNQIIKPTFLKSVRSLSVTIRDIIVRSKPQDILLLGQLLTIITQIII